jgi:hypothetical protein
MSINNWTKVLRLCDMWQMDDLNSVAVSTMEALFTDKTSALKLRIACDHSIEKWKYPAIARMVLRDFALTSNDITILGAKMAADILRVRERDIFACHSDLTERTDTKVVTDREIYTSFGCKSPWLIQEEDELESI